MKALTKKVLQRSVVLRQLEPRSKGVQVLVDDSIRTAKKSASHYRLKCGIV